MMQAGWLDSDLVLDALQRRSSHEALQRGRALLAQDRVGEVEEKELTDGLAVTGRVGTPGEEHVVALYFTSSRLDGHCDCGYRPWPCAHVLALAMSWGRKGGGLQPGRGEPLNWRKVLAGLTTPSRRVTGSGGEEVLVHWVSLRPAPTGVWTVGVGWRLHRAGARGLGRGRPVDGATLLESCAAWLPGADARVVRTVQACCPEPAALPTGAPLVVAPDAVDVVLRALATADRVCWAESHREIEFDLLPVSIRLMAEEQRGGFAVQLQWRTADGAPWQPEDLRVLGRRFPWIECDGILHPLLGIDDGAALAVLSRRGVDVPASDLPALLGSVVPRLEVGGVEVEIQGLEGRDFLISDTPRPRLYLSEEAGTLVGTLAFAYGDYEVAGEDPDAVVRVGVGQGTYVRRDMEGEFHAAMCLRDLGFRMADAGRFEMDGDGAFDFLRSHLDELTETWEVFGRGELRRYRVSASAVSLRVRVTTGIDWLDLALEATVPGDELAVEEVIRALRKGNRYVRLGSGHHALLPEEWSRRVGPNLETLGIGARNVRVPHYLAPLVQEIADEVPLEQVGHDRTWSQLAEVLGGAAAVPEYPVPQQLRAQLRPYQVHGYRWLRFMAELGFGCVLADDMGLGKTVQALAVLVGEGERGRGEPSLVVAPTSVVPNWESEARRFAPQLRVLRHHGAERQQHLATVQEYDLVITSYAVLRRDVEDLSAMGWNYVLLDEAQAIKNAATQTARAARRLVARRRLTLTGTPLENHLGELWSQFQFLMPGLLGSERHFATSFAQPIAQGGAEAREGLRRRIGPFMLRRLKSQVASDLPEKVESVLLCEMGEEQERLYRSLLVASRDRVLREVERKGLARARFSVLEALLRLRQACCLPSILPGEAGADVPSAKFDLFRDFVAEVVDEGHRVLVFSQFVKVLAVLRDWFEEAAIPYLYLDGRTRNREERVRRFQEDESIAAFLVSLKAGGAGLNLTAADYVILFDPWWNPAVEAQATDRAHRIGQSRKVFAYKMITRGTVEEKILELQERKRELTDQLIDSAGAWGDQITEADLEDLFRL